MQRRLRFLSFALYAGFIAVVAAAIPLFASGATPMPTQIQYTKTTQVKLSGPMTMFVHPKATSETTTFTPTRMRSDAGDTSHIVQCDTKRFINIDNKARTYWSMTFDQYRAAMQATMDAMSAKIKGMTPPPSKPGPSQPPIQGSGAITISVNTVDDPNTKQILGMTAHHVTETITGTSNGTGDCPSGSMTMTNDEWYVPNPVTFACPIPRPVPPQMPVAPNAPRGQGPNPCMGRFSVEAKGKSSGDKNRFALMQDSTMNIGMKFTTHEEITQFLTQPYNPSVFDPPAGYTQVTAPADLSGMGH